ncbi:MAG: protein kinase [Myxococcales bacterium]|nr:protein kinase [Myxococcales bacterium]
MKKKQPSVTAKQGVSADYGGWELHNELGAGGNGIVYEAHRGSERAALKVLRKSYWKGNRLDRFRDEVAAMERCLGLAGVIPLLDHRLPEKPSKKTPPWLAMGLATPLEEALTGASLDEVVTLVHAVAATLTEMHALGVSHRDVKPDNILWFEGAWAVGDLGLADFEAKRSTTAEGEKLGPAFFIAPEMLNTAKTADGGPADVYSLAKTLWVLATGQRFPLPGHQARGVAMFALNTWISDPRAALLEAVLAAATLPTPTQRPTMADFRDELSRWLNPPTPKPMTDDDLDLSELQQDLAGRHARVAAEDQERRDFEDVKRAYGQQFNERFDGLASELEQALRAGGFEWVDRQASHWGFTVSATVPAEKPPRGPDDLRHIRIELYLGLSRHELGGQIEVDARFELTPTPSPRRPKGEPHRWPWRKVYTTLAGSQSEEGVFAEIEGDMRQAFGPFVRSVVDMSKQRTLT